MKRIAAALLCLLLLAGCRGAGPADGTTDTAEADQTTTAQADHHVILHTAAGDYTPNLRPLGSRRSNAVADALPIFPEDAAAALTEEEWVTLPVSFDFGEPLLGQSYQLYTLSELKELPWQETFEPPKETGAYLCIARVSFGTEKEYDSYQYVFGFGVGGAAFRPYVPEPPMGSVLLHGRVLTNAPPIRPEDAAAALTEEDWVTLPVEFEFIGPIRIQSYEIYTLSDIQRVYRGTSFEPPEAPGDYLCIAKADFHGDEKRACWQYVFAFEVP